MNIEWPLHLGAGVGTALGYGALRPLNEKAIIHLKNRIAQNSPVSQNHSSNETI